MEIFSYLTFLTRKMLSERLPTSVNFPQYPSYGFKMQCFLFVLPLCALGFSPAILHSVWESHI